MRLVSIYSSLLYLILFVFGSFSTHAQSTKPTASDETTTIEIKNADTFEFIKTDSTQIKKLIGNVVLLQHSSTFRCDSAYIYDDNNDIDAYGNIHILQEDSINIYADYLKYNGNSRRAVLNQNVRLMDEVTQIKSDTLIYLFKEKKAILYDRVYINDSSINIVADSLEYFSGNKKAYLYHNIELTDDDMTLTSERMDYDFRTKVGKYQKGGQLINKSSVLTSQSGTYYTEEKRIIFNDDVVVEDPDYILSTERLTYYSLTEYAEFSGETKIESDENTIYTTLGSFDKQADAITLMQRPLLSNPPYILEADSIYYKKKAGKGWGYRNVSWQDTTEQMTITSEAIEYEDANEYVLATQDALLTKIMNDDTLYLSADTLTSFKLPQDSLSSFTAYPEALIFKSNMQGACDSLSYSFSDSSFRFFGKPVLWVDDTQLYADSIWLETIRNKPHLIHLKNAAFIGNESDSGVYNQLKGNTIDGFFIDGKLNHLLVKGAAESIYFAKNDQQEYTGANKAKSIDMAIYISEDEKVSKIKFFDLPSATYYPMNKIDPYGFMLDAFLWRAEERPENKEAVINRTP